jgi:Ca2+-binding RTX toxin-like protein
MRGLLNRDGTSFFDPWPEESATAAAAFARFDLGPDAGATPQAAAQPGPQALIDTVPGDTGTTATLTVGAAPVISAVDTIADQDFYQITLVAGHEYQIGMFGYSPSGPGDPVGPNGVPLLDSFLELYDHDGNLITSADGGSDTVLNSANSGFDALLSFTATESGTYYVNARAFDNIPVDGDDGDLAGDYGLYAKDVTDDPSVFTPYYDADSPLFAIDWGTQVNKVHQTYRNPDGNEGIRDTGNPQSPVDPGAALGHPGKNVISIYFAQAGDIFVSNDPANPGLPPATITATGVQGFEHDAVMTALGEFEKVADIVYVEVNDRADADFVYTSYIGTPGPGVSLLGSMSPPDESDEGLAQFNSGDERWNARDLAQGGFSFVTLIHEFGHGHGLAHPHDNGGHSGIMHGVESEGVVADYTLGDYDLNQSVFTMMSYEDGWQTSPYGNAETDVGYGYLGGLMAFDIAAIQDKYGVNEDWATGNDTYVLKDVNAAGTYYSSIWDMGGTDSIVYAGARDANIDLRAASLQYEYGGGGWVSYAFGIYGGFTIANSVVIENASGGAGNDILIGNDVANILTGGLGTDVMTGGLGNDWYYVDRAADRVNEGAGQGTLDRVFASADYTLNAGAYVEILSTDWHAGTAAIRLGGNELNNTIMGNAGDNVLRGYGGADRTLGLGGNDFYFVDNAGDYVAEAASAGNDRVFSSLSYTLAGGQSVETLSTDNNAGTAAINLTGNALVNTIFGNAGDNVLNGGGGADALAGFAGNDYYFVDNAGDHVIEAASGGADRVFAGVSYSLTAGQSVEILSTDWHAGTAAIDLGGNELANSIIGNAGANILDGKGGNDALAGFGGADQFLFDTALGAGNVDRLLDFQSATDKIVLDDAVFTGLGLGTLAAGAFVTGAAAGDGNDRIIYNSTTGALLFDADGTGGGAAVQFAQLGAGTILVASDFTII